MTQSPQMLLAGMVRGVSAPVRYNSLKCKLALEDKEAALGGRCFDEASLRGENASYRDGVDKLHDKFGIDFVTMGLAAFVGAPLKWVYSAGATSERFKRISLAPGHGIGGIVLKAGKPMLFTDIDSELDPREFSSYPIVFAEDLRGFCCFPLVRGGSVVGALLLAFRAANEKQGEVYRACLEYLGGKFCDLEIVSDGYLDFEQLAERSASSREEVFATRTDVSHVISAQEEERRRISRELHDGLAQELLTVSLQLDLALVAKSREEAMENIKDCRARITGILDEIHDISVNLRPSTLDHFGLLAALRSQAAVYLQSFGVAVEFYGSYKGERFDSAYEIQIYRILQEAILNACKYSGADSVEVYLDEADGWISAVVVDHGKGFDTDNPPILGSGCGLPGMGERIALIGGTLDISSDETGTKIALLAPMLTSRDSKEDSR